MTTMKVIESNKTFVTLFSGNKNEALYFVNVIEEGIAEKLITDCYGHVVYISQNYTIERHEAQKVPDHKYSCFCFQLKMFMILT